MNGVNLLQMNNIINYNLISEKKEFYKKATKEIEKAINDLLVNEDVKKKIYNKNIMNLINKEG